ncbi:MAG: hypothetical protein ACRC57_00040 [Sarcina sp.]
MSEQLFYLKDKVSDIVDDFVVEVNDIFYKPSNHELITKDAIINKINISRHINCNVPKGIPLFDIVEISSDTSDTLGIECHCCGETLYSITHEK